MPELELTPVREFLLHNLGLNFNVNQEKELYGKLTTAAENFNFDNTDNFINWLIKQKLDNKFTEKLATFLTIGETYFFREKKALDYIEFEYLPDLIRKRRNKDQRLRIWSAGCASGEEPYTIAILLKRIIPDIENWDITILATDINIDFLNKAKKGIYTKWSFRGIPDSFKSNYFKVIDKNKYSINADIKKMVKFSYLNLASDHYPSLNTQTNAFDIILCRNVLIYFSLEGTVAVTSKLYNSLIEKGILLVSPVEASNIIYTKFHRFPYKGVTIYQKETAKASNNNKNGFDESMYKKLLNNGITTTNKPTYQFKKKNNFTVPSVEKKLKAVPKAIIPKKKVEPQNGVEKSEYKKAIMLYKSGLYNDAERLIEIGISNKSDNQKALVLLLARIKANKGLLDESEKLCLQVIKNNKIDEEAYYLLATVQNEKGKTAEAIEALNKTLFLNPDFPLGHFLLGNILMGQGEQAEGKKHFRNTLKSLSKLKADEILAESDGLTVNRLTEIINSLNA